MTDHSSQTFAKLTAARCRACSGEDQKLTDAQTAEYLAAIPGWEQTDGRIFRTFAFKNYYETIAFVNAVAWISHREDHHPDLEVSYKTCRIVYSTHSVGGLSENDFICAAKVEALML